MKDLQLLGGNILMKAFYKVLVLGILMIAFTAVTVTTTFAQTEQEKKVELYNTFINNYEGNLEKKKIALKAAKEYVAKYGENAEDKQYVDYFKSAIPALEAQIKALIKEKKEAEDAAELRKLYQNFNTNFEGKNFDGVYQVGGQILAKKPDLIDVILVLGSLGLDESQKNPPVDKYNANTIKYAKSAIQKINAGVKSDNFGLYQYRYKTKGNALGWMNYTIGNIMYHRNGKGSETMKKAALPYLYKATQYNSETKKFSNIYATIGDWYFDKVIAFQKNRVKLETDYKALNTSTETEEEKKAKADELQMKIDESVAIEKGYAGRAIDAYSRAYSYARSNPKTPATYKTNLFNRLKGLYGFRFEKQPAMKTDAKINADVSAINTKPMPNPSSAVMPVKGPAKPAESTDETKTGAKAGTTRTRMATKKAGTR